MMGHITVHHAAWPSVAISLSLMSILTPASALTQGNFTPPIALSTQTPDFNQAYKPKIVSQSNGTIIVVYGDSVEDDPTHYAYDPKLAITRPARDVFVRSCDSETLNCGDISNWSTPINIANTATLSSISTDWNGDGMRTPYYGDAEKAAVFTSGAHIVISWVAKYCPGGAQRTVTYLELGSREVPMSCLYVAHTSADPAIAANWQVDRLTDGSREADNDVTQGISSGVWAVAWQEDPLGLQLGEADGPGEGASGAKTSNGTDIWYSYTSNVATASGAIGVWSTPARITDNQTGFGITGSFNPVRDSNGLPVDPTLIEKGSTGASRVNLAIVGGSNPPKTVLAYEETKGSSGLDEGKFLRYHTFNYNAPPTDTVCNDPMAYENCRAGCIVSNPFENARRARFVTQTNAGSNSGIRWALFWREGIYTKGGPADVMLRLGYTNFAPSNLQPAVDASCFATNYAAAAALNNSPALNISSNTLTATSANLSDSSNANQFENARAHRAVLRGDDLNVGYIYTPEWAVAETTDMANYNFFVRHFDATNGQWRAPVNLSNITDTTINVKEPRLQGPPGNGPGCVNPAAPTDPRDCQNGDVLVAAWGTETNVYAYIASPVNLDIFITRSTDQAQSFEPVVSLAGGPNIQGESQLRITPDGTEIYAVWTETDNSGATNSIFSQITGQAIPPPSPTPTPTPTPTPAATPPANSDFLGCSLNPQARFDPLLPLLLATGIIYLGKRRKLTNQSAN